MSLSGLRRAWWIAGVFFLCGGISIAENAPTCTKKPLALPAGTTLTISPLSANAGANISLSVLGKKIKDYGVLFCPCSPSTTNVSPILVIPDTQKSTDDARYFQVSFPQGVSDIFNVYLVDTTGKPYDTKKQFLVGTVGDTSYVECGLGIPRESTNGNLACSFVPLTHDAARKMFGKGIADQYLVVQVTVRNTSKDLEFLFQDIRLGTPVLMQGSVDRRLMRGLAENTEQFSARAIAFRLTAAGATLLTGISGVVDNNLLTSAAALVAGPTQTGLTGAIPNLSSAEIARLDDLGFTTTSTVIPKSTSIPVVAFLSYHPLYSKEVYIHLDNDAPKLLEFWSSLQVLVAGTHVQQAKLGTPTLKTFLPPTPTVVAKKKLGKDLALVIQGTGLTSVTSVLLKPRGTPAKANVTAQLQPISGQSALDNDVDQLVIPAGAELDEGVYDIWSVTKDNHSISTSGMLTVSAAPAAPTPAPAAPAPKPAESPPE